MIICACCSWKMTLNGGFDASVDNVGRKGVRREGGQVNGTEAMRKIMRLLYEFSLGVSQYA